MIGETAQNNLCIVFVFDRYIQINPDEEISVKSAFDSHTLDQQDSGDMDREALIGWLTLKRSNCSFTERRVAASEKQ